MQTKKKAATETTSWLETGPDFYVLKSTNDYLNGRFELFYDEKLNATQEKTEWVLRDRRYWEDSGIVRTFEADELDRALECGLLVSSLPTSEAFELMHVREVRLHRPDFARGVFDPEWRNRSPRYDSAVKMANALRVLLLTDATTVWLYGNDPQALKQARGALQCAYADAHPYEVTTTVDTVLEEYIIDNVLYCIEAHLGHEEVSGQNNPTWYEYSCYRLGGRWGTQKTFSHRRRFECHWEAFRAMIIYAGEKGGPK